MLPYPIFQTIEYLTGGKYLKYLEQNSTTIPLEESFSYDILTEDIEKNKLIMVGEIHGFKEPTVFDFDFFKYLHENHGVRTYFAELDFVQSTLMNQFLRSGDEVLLNEILEKWIVAQGRNNKDYYDKYKKFYLFYQELSEDEKFKFIGVDKVQNWSLLNKYINKLSSVDTTLNPLTIGDGGYLPVLKNRIDTLNELYSANSETLYLLSHLSKNITYYEEKLMREDVMFKNFEDLYTDLGLRNEKTYGYFGLFHIFQYRVNGDHPLASQIRTSELGLEDKILSINFLMNDSHMVRPSNSLPKFLQDEGKYTRMAVGADNVLVMYLYGIKDLKRMTKENEKSLIKMNGEISPYANSSRLTKTIQLLPVTDVFKMEDKGKPYVQYTIFVRNSDWAEPY